MTPTPTDELEDRLAELLRAAQEPLGAWAREAADGVDRRPAHPDRRRVLVAVAASVALVGAGAGVWAARDGEDHAEPPLVVTDDPTTTSAPEPSTTTAPPDPAAPPPVVGPAAIVDERIAVVGHRDGFAAVVTHADGTTVFRSSPDGTTWEEHAIELGGTVDHLMSDGSTLTAVGVQGEWGHDRLPSAWRSTDDGATWSGGPMPLPDLPPIQDSLLSVSVTSTATGDAGVLVTSMATWWLDLFALVERQTGQPFPEGARIEAEGTTITITPVDGEPFTVDASGADPSISVLTRPIEFLITWMLRPDGTWETAVDDAGTLPYAVTGGPVGYLGWVRGQLVRSVDGRTWDEVAAPEGVDPTDLANPPALASDGRRYLLVVLDAGGVGPVGVAATSTDLRSWEVAPLPLDGNIVYPTRVVGGGAGFVSVASSWTPADPAARPPVVVERDGRRLTLDRGAGLVTVVDVATGAELLRWEGDLDHMPANVFVFVDGEVHYLDPATGEVVIRVPFDEMNQAIAVSDDAAEAAAPADQDVLVWSADGLHWEQRPLGDSTYAITPLAVADDGYLLLPGPPQAG